MKLNLTQNQKRIIQKIVKLEDRRGFKSSAAIIDALILVTGNRGLSFNDIQETLELSKGAVSMGLNLLMGIGRLESFKKFNERKRYFRMPYNSSLEEHIEESLEIFLGVKELLSELMADNHIVFDKEFEKIIEEDLKFADFISKKITMLIKEWKEEENDEKI